ncbi:MAG: PKD domain-containing protein [Thiocapsa sp.]|uniref:PKD domain-containing protein n=1 Tax=Thiocapsa sp. TaxID=2024551 RepID=UPI001BD14ACF|nr:PKD domain-containing protein [Thiocapsa sp.]QVL50302.1 MAG: PKD domain-containing protein [Thiocapsa sp.]
MNLSAEGGVDWVHWGRSTSADVSRKAGVATQIGALTSIDGTRFGRFSNTSRPAYAWSDGTPTASATTNAGLVLAGAGRGYALTAPADTDARTLVVYVGGWKSDARLDVSLSDGSSAPYSVTLSHLNSVRDDYDARLAITYQAASAGQTLNLRYVQTSGIGTVNFMGATLQGGSTAVPPTPAPVAAFTASAESGTAPLTVTFTSQSTGDISAYGWSLGDGSKSTAETAEHTYQTAGTYDVSLTVSGPSGTDTLQKSALIVVKEPAPVADFAANVGSGTAPLTVTFSDQSSGSVTGWAWAFGDGETSQAQQPTHTYTKPGRYAVNLSVSGPGGSDSLVRSDYIEVKEPAPVADFAANVSSGTAPLTVTFSDQSSGSVTGWTWSFGDGATSQAQQPTHTYTKPGLYAVNLSVSGPGGSDSLVRSDYIEVKEPAPVADFAANVTSGPAPLTVTFSDQSSGSVAGWTWSFGDGETSQAQQPTHTYTKPGRYAVNLSVSGPGGSDSLVRSDYIEVKEPAPVADFAANVTSGPAPLTVTFSDQSSGSVTGWTWSFGDGETSQSQQPTHTYTKPGRYAVNLSVSGPGGSDTLDRADYIDVSASGLLEAELSATSSSVNLTSEGMLDYAHWGRSTAADINRKAGVAAQIGALTSIDGARFGRFNNSARPAYTWSDGTPTASATTNAGVVLSGAGRGYALTVPADTDARTLVVYVGGWKSDARLDVSLSDGSAAPYSVKVSHLDSLRDDYDTRLAITYQAASAGQTLNLRYVQTSSIGTLNFMGATLQGGSTSVPPTPAPVAAFTASTESGTAPLTVTFTSQSTGDISAYGWSLGDGSKSIAETAVHTYQTAGTYDVSLTVSGTSGTDTLHKPALIVVKEPAPEVQARLDANLSATGSSMNLTSEGTIDWAHWGRSTAGEVNRKASVAAQIGALASIDGTRFGRFSNSARSAYTWSDGMPTVSATTNAGLVLSGAGRGYALTVPADTDARTLVVYVGGWKSDARLDVSLSDGSAAPYSVKVSHLDSLRDDYDARLAITYQAASAGQTLNLRYVQTSSSGTLNFMAASLQGASAARTAQAEADVSEPAIEIGEVEINQEWQRVDFQRTFNDPIVVAKALSANDSDPAVVRIDGIDSKGFWIRVQEWDYLDGWHDLETVSYMAMERGRHTLESGVQIEAGSVTTAVTNAFQGQLFEAPFADVPVVFTAVTSANGPEAAMSRLGNIGVDGFDIGLRTEAASVPEHTAERIDYIAWEVSTGVVDGLRYEVGRTGKDVDHRTYNLLYQNVFARAPVIVADVQSSDGTGTAALRWQNLNIESVDLRVQPEESLGDVAPQIAEQVGYFLADVE